MKLTLTFKTPDVMEQEFGDENLHRFGPTGTEEEVEKAYEVQTKAKALVEKHVSYGEYITVEFDTDTGKATVL